MGSTICVGLTVHEFFFAHYAASEQLMCADQRATGPSKRAHGPVPGASAGKRRCVFLTEPPPVVGRPRVGERTLRKQGAPAPRTVGGVYGQRTHAVHANGEVGGHDAAPRAVLPVPTDNVGGFPPARSPSPREDGDRPPPAGGRAAYRIPKRRPTPVPIAASVPLLLLEAFKRFAQGCGCEDVRRELSALGVHI